MTKYYVAGFFDADGYITIAKAHKNERPTLYCGFTNTVKPLLESIQEFIQTKYGITGRICTKRKKKKDHHLISYDLKFTGPRVSELLSKLPIKHPKKVARLVIGKQILKCTPRNGKYTEELKQKRELLCQQFLAVL